MVFIVYYKRIGMSLIHPLCDLCNHRHHFTNDGFEYFDCWNNLIKKKSRKEPTVEIWDKGRKEWVIKGS